MEPAIETRDKLIALKTHAKKFQIQGISFIIRIFVERENEISKNNAKLIKNLLEISHGKRASVPTT